MTFQIKLVDPQALSLHKVSLFIAQIFLGELQMQFYILLFTLFLSFQTNAQQIKNLNIGINTLLLYQSSNRGNSALSEVRNGFDLQESELQFTADVDPDWKLSSFFAIKKEVEVDSTVTPNTRSEEFIFEPEEVFAETLSLDRVTLKFGKFKAAFGNHNKFHTHAFPFIDAPLFQQNLLGEEGLNDHGTSAAILLPAHWYSEVIFQILSGQGEGLDYFKSNSANQNIQLIQVKNLWDLSEQTTIELTGSGATGKNTSNRTTNLLGAHLTLKWRQDKTQSFTWNTEVLERQNNQATDEKGSGLTSYVQYQLNQRWWLQARGEYLKIKNQGPTNPEPLPSTQKKYSALIGYIPSEFSGLRLQYDHLEDGSGEPEQKLMLQMNLSIGAHPAHQY